MFNVYAILKLRSFHGELSDTFTSLTNAMSFELVAIMGVESGGRGGGGGGDASPPVKNLGGDVPPDSRMKWPNPNPVPFPISGYFEGRLAT